MNREEKLYAAALAIPSALRVFAAAREPALLRGPATPREHIFLRPRSRSPPPVPMITPLTISDFLHRAALVYPDRIGIIDAPDSPPHPSAASRIGRSPHVPAAMQLCHHSRPPWHPGRRTRRDCVAQFRPPSVRPVWKRRKRPHPCTGEFSPQPRGECLHHRPRRSLPPARRSRSRRPARQCALPAPRRVRPRIGRPVRLLECRTRALGRVRKRHRHDHLPHTAPPPHASGRGPGDPAANIRPST